ncbi:cytochrome-c peroxidase [Bordetella genomosp. 5]|uniref:Cytochrome C biogenesis protein CcsA n=1 Tax=Bordetella genomosp. 5 TaxID=1395608 RepID=A0A261TV93_9BORD|nr:cytochrome-c peroxidase [Bordetella genomosp. 5]OZI53608.1 cytochrome C biogenesis protein CcsA [Bordetella genomosp. 5]
MRKHSVSWGVGIVLALWAGQAMSASQEPIQPIEPVVIKEPEKVELGKMLFFDPRLSRSGAISCNSCHNLAMGGSDNLKASIGHQWQMGGINSPTVLNSSMNIAQFWDGRAKDLREQAGGPIANPAEMASSHEVAVQVLNSIPGYRSEFKRVFGKDGITIDEVTSALAAFEETLVTPNSRFDKWLKGDKNALTVRELAGYQLFKNSGCVACHNGAAVGGNSFQKMGLVSPYVTDNKAEGRAGVTGQDADRFNFKVPTLRNVALTYPYFHDGEAATLTQAVDVMGRLQLGRTFTDEENGQIVAFLKTLTGDQPVIQYPVLPPSEDDTPRPEPFVK